MRRRAFLWIVALLPLVPATASAQDEPVVIYLVRHSERAEDGTNDSKERRCDFGLDGDCATADVVTSNAATSSMPRA